MHSEKESTKCIEKLNLKNLGEQIIDICELFIKNNRTFNRMKMIFKRKI